MGAPPPGTPHPCRQTLVQVLSMHLQRQPGPGLMGNGHGLPPQDQSGWAETLVVATTAMTAAAIMLIFNMAILVR